MSDPKQPQKEPGVPEDLGIILPDGLVVKPAIKASAAGAAQQAQKEPTKRRTMQTEQSNKELEGTAFFQVPAEFSKDQQEKLMSVVDTLRRTIAERIDTMLPPAPALGALTHVPQRRRPTRA